MILQISISRRELEIIDLNISALVGSPIGYLQKIRERKSGTIINVSSAAGFQPIPFMATYAASKAFVSSFSEAIAEENRPYGIHDHGIVSRLDENEFLSRRRTSNGQSR